MNTATLVSAPDAEAINWQIDPASGVWDSCLARLGGHPLQSALWGQARRAVDGIDELRFLATQAGRPLFMARVERRRIPVLGSIAWMPKGPAHNDHVEAKSAYTQLLDMLKQRDFILAVDGAYPTAIEATPPGRALPPRTQTAVLDIAQGKDALWSALDSQWRYGVGRAERLGVTVERSKSANDLRDFFSLCETTSRQKRFDLPGSLALLEALVNGRSDGEVSMELFVARVESRLAAGAAIFRCGMRVHYFWGATDRDLSRFRAGEAVQWAVIEWACKQGMRSYDLEGLDRAANPGTYAFKAKMGGNIITLPIRQANALNLRGGLVLALNKLVNRL